MRYAQLYACQIYVYMYIIRSHLPTWQYHTRLLDCSAYVTIPQTVTIFRFCRCRHFFMQWRVRLSIFFLPHSLSLSLCSYIILNAIQRHVRSRNRLNKKISWKPFEQQYGAALCSKLCATRTIHKNGLNLFPELNLFGGNWFNNGKIMPEHTTNDVNNGRALTAPRWWRRWRRWRRRRRRRQNDRLVLCAYLQIAKRHTILARHDA